MRNKFLSEQFLEGRRTISRTNEKDTARMIKFPHIICSTNPQRRRRRRRRRNATQHKTRTSLSNWVPSRFMYQNAFSLIMQTTTTTKFVKSNAHIRTIPSARLFIDALSIQRYFFGALARRFLYTMYAPAIMICTATTTARYMPILGAEEVTTGRVKGQFLEFISSCKNMPTIRVSKGMKLGENILSPSVAGRPSVKPPLTLLIVDWSSLRWDL